MRKEFLDDFGEGLVDCVVVDRGELEGKGDRSFKLLEESSHICLNHVKAFYLLIITHEHITVNFVDEYLVYNVRLDLTCLFDQISEPNACTFIIRLMCVNYINQGPALLNLTKRVHFEGVSTREIDDIELNILIVVD